VTGLARRVGARTNLSPFNNASWLLAVAILAIVIPANDKIASNLVFFAAHGVSPVAWAVVLVVGLAVFWAILAGVLWLVRRFLPDLAYDVIASLLMFLVTWFFVGNALAITVLTSSQWLAAVAGIVLAGALTLLARRFAMGSVLVVFAGVAAAVPLVATLWNGAQAPAPTAYAFDDASSRPNVLWVISDELSYPAAFAEDGTPRPGLTNLQALADDATVYNHVYTAANFTDYAIPAMLNGDVDLSAMSDSEIQQMRSSLGVIPGLSSTYSVVMESPVFSYDCSDATCASVGVGGDQTAVQRYWGFVKDTAAIAGKTALAAPFSNAFPAVDGKWSNFWDGGEEFGNDPEGDTVQNVVSGIRQVTTANPEAPFFAFWHTIRTHAPWVLDPEGKDIYPARVPIVDGAHMIGEEADETYTSDELKKLERRLWHYSVEDFDRQLGTLIDDLKASGQYDNTMIVVTADHGAAMTDTADRRVGDDPEQRWSEIAHVPLVIKMPGQTTGDVNTDVHASGQIAGTVLKTVGATPGSGTSFAPDLSQPQPGGPVFTNVKNGAMTGWHYPDGFVDEDPWQPDDFTPANPTYPFAVGVDASLLGQPVPAGFTALTDARVQTLPGESTQQVLIVDRPSASCSPDDRVGLVADAGTVVGSVLWEGPSGSSDGGTTTRGWAIVPRAAALSDYAFSCTTP
jgi:hypothetical protein